MSEKAYTISAYVLIPLDDGDGIDALAEVQAGIERACGDYLTGGYLIETSPGIPAKVSDRL